MKHGFGFRKLGRTKSHRWLMLRTMVTQLIRHERILTTLPKAKELRKVADKMVTLAKVGTLHSRRQAHAVITEEEMVIKLFTEFEHRYRLRAGGYTRILHSKRRNGDAAHMAFIEFVDREGELRPARPPNSMLPMAAQVISN